MDFPGVITEEKTISMTPIIAQSRKQYLATLKAGTNVIDTVKVVRRRKTWKQCKTIFGQALKQIENQFEEWGYDTSYLYKWIDTPTGVAISKDNLIDLFYNLFPIYRDGARITLSKMTTIEASTFYEKIRNYVASQWSIVIPEPDPNWKEKEDG